MTLNDLRRWHHERAEQYRKVGATVGAAFHDEAVVCLDYAIQAWDKLSDVRASAGGAVGGGVRSTR